MCRSEDNARLAAMAARVAAMEQALAAREAQMAQDAAAPRRQASVQHGHPSAAGIHAGSALDWPEPAKNVRCAPSAALPPSRSSAARYTSAAASRLSSPRQSSSAAEERSLGNRDEPGRLLARDGSMRDPKSQRVATAEEQRCCAMRRPSAKLQGDAARDGLCQRDITVLAFQRSSLARRVTGQKFQQTQADCSLGCAQTPSSAGSGRRPPTARPAPSEPAGHSDDESQPRGHLPAPTRARPALCPSHEGDDHVAEARHCRAIPQRDNVALSRNSTLNGGRHTAHRTSQSASDDAHSSDDGQPSPAAFGNSRSRRKAAPRKSAGLPNGFAAVREDPSLPAARRSSSQHGAADGLRYGAPGDPTALLRENAALRVALHSCNASAAAAQVAAQHMDDKFRELTLQVETVSAAAADDAQRSAARVRSLEDEVEDARTAIRREAEAAAGSATHSAQSAAVADECMRRAESLDAELASAQQQLVTARWAC